jgi:hypothetical protein
VPTPPLASLALPHTFDSRVLLEDYDRVLQFLRSVEKVRERERTNGNGEFFHIVAAQGLELASLQYVFKHPPTEIIETAKRGIKDFVFGLELGHPIEPMAAFEYFLAAVAVNDRPSAYVITSAPDDTLGFLDDPDDPFPLLVTAAFAFAADQDSEVDLNLELLHGILFESPLDKAYYPMKREMASLYHLMASIQSRDAAEFDRHLLERSQARVDIFNEDTDDDKPSVIDWTALGLVCFARERGLAVTAQHVYVPLAIVETTARLTRH